VAYELRKQLRSFELIYRLGGEEFLIVLPGIDREGGRELAERLRAAVADAQPTGIPITISIGLSAGRAEQVDYDVLFKAADEALYEAKRAGRNRVVVAAEGIVKPAPEGFQGPEGFPVVPVRENGRVGTAMGAS
jgi:diguanylate cyclase (GGDEF)-like protein